MPNSLCTTLLLLATAALLPAAQLKATHDVETGITQFTIEATAPDHQYIIYRSREALTPEDLDQAQVVASGLTTSQPFASFAATATGLFHYTLVSANRLGRATRIEDQTALQETDRTPPAPPRPTLRYQDGAPILEWLGPPPENPEAIRRYRIYRTAASNSPAECIAELKRTRAPEQTFRDDNWPPQADYTITAIDRSGLESAPSAPLHARRAPDLAISQKTLVSTNPDLATSKMYPIPGETVRFTATIHNYGALPSQSCRATVTSCGATLLDDPFPALPPGSSHTIEWFRQIDAPGEYETTIDIDPDQTSGDENASDNRLTFRAAAVEKPVFFLWYGEVPHLPYANTSQCIPASIEECHRRGAFAMRAVGISQNTADNAYDAFPQMGYDGFSVDEIFQFNDAAQRLAQILPTFRKKHSDTLVCVWTIGTQAAPEIVQLVKDGIIDLLLFEVYVKPGEDTAPLRTAIENFRAYGIIDHCVMGLVTDQTWSNWTSPEVQRDSILEQMRLVRSLAPETPGFAFWSANTQPGVAEAVDEECYRLFFKIGFK